jgi:hypothetical protein
MIYYELAGQTREEVEEKFQELCRSYHPAGYGTSYSMRPCFDDKLCVWKARVYRYASCD